MTSWSSSVGCRGCIVVALLCYGMLCSSSVILLFALQADSQDLATSLSGKKGAVRYASKS